MGIPVGSKLFPTAFAGEAIDGPCALPDLISIIIPPFSAAGIIAEVSLPAGFRLFQKRAAVPAHTARCRVLGEEHPDTLKTLSNMAAACDSLGDHAKELELRETLYALRCRVLGEGEWRTLRSLSVLIRALDALGKTAEALALCVRFEAVADAANAKSIQTVADVLAAHGETERAGALRARLS